MSTTLTGEEAAGMTAALSSTFSGVYWFSFGSASSARAACVIPRCCQSAFKDVYSICGLKEAVLKRRLAYVIPRCCQCVFKDTNMSTCGLKGVYFRTHATRLALKKAILCMYIIYPYTPSAAPSLESLVCVCVCVCMNACMYVCIRPPFKR